MSDEAVSYWAGAALPWQQAQWQRLLAGLQADRLAHGLLITGGSGVGKGHLARGVASTLRCRAGAGEPCGTCQGCRLMAQGAHPDFHACIPADPSKPRLGIDQIRELAERMTLTSQFGGRRVALVEPADGMTLNAANSLLKTLEEPPPQAVLILVAVQEARLPATIRSRCQILRIQPPPQAQAVAWLREQDQGEAASRLLPLAGGGPLRALELAEAGAGEAVEGLQSSLQRLALEGADPVSEAMGWSGKGQAQRLLPWLQALVADLGRIQFGGSDAGRFWDAVPGGRLAGAIPSERLHEYDQWLAETRRALEQPLNDQLLAEEAFVRWRRLARTG